MSICGFLAASSCGVFIHPKTHSPKESSEYLSPISLVADAKGKTLYIADATARTVTVFDVNTNKVTNTIVLANNPGGLAIAPDGSRLYVASGSSNGTIEIVDLALRRVVKSIPVGHTPCAPVVSPDGKKLFVYNRFDNNISVIDLFRNLEISRIPMLREPIAAAITPDGKFLFVANHLPSGRVIYEYVRDAQIMMIGSYTAQRSYGGGKKVGYAATGVILVVDTATNRLRELIPLRDGATGLKGICISPDGRNAYITHILANYKVPTTKIEHGGINANALSIIDVPNMKFQNTVLLDDSTRGAANPWDVKCSPDGKFICITHAGTHEISVINHGALHKKLEAAKTAYGDSSIVEVPKDTAFLSGLRKRLPLKGDGPRGMAIVGTKVYAAEYFSDSVGIIDYASSDTANCQSVALGPTPEKISEARKGELLFNDARICFQGWQSCASCHPEGRADGLNWDLMNDGAGNPKQTKSLLLSHKTPPSMITGIRADAETAVRAGIEHILFTKQPEETATAMDTYLKSMQPVPSPYMEKGKLSKDAKNGEKIFKKAGCGKCHTPPLFTDLKKYDVGVGIDPEKNRAFDTPTLIEVWRTAPFLYDGRAELMYEVFRSFGKDDMHGSVSKIKIKDLFDLAEYVISL